MLDKSGFRQDRMRGSADTSQPKVYAKTRGVSPPFDVPFSVDRDTEIARDRTLRRSVYADVPDAERVKSMSRLERFREAQNSVRSGFDSALDEIRSGGKRGHWIWYVFPQISGLGASGPSQTFAIDGEEEAAEFLRDSELRSRLLTIADAVAEQLRTRQGRSLRALMGSDIDARKVVSSLTLFGLVARKLRGIEGIDAYSSIANVADEVLAAAESQGYPPCAYTLRRIRGTA